MNPALVPHYARLRRGFSCLTAAQIDAGDALRTAWLPNHLPASRLLLLAPREAETAEEVRH